MRLGHARHFPSRARARTRDNGARATHPPSMRRRLGAWCRGPIEGDPLEYDEFAPRSERSLSNRGASRRPASRYPDVHDRSIPVTLSPEVERRHRVSAVIVHVVVDDALSPDIPQGSNSMCSSAATTRSAADAPQNAEPESLDRVNFGHERMTFVPT